MKYLSFMILSFYSLWASAAPVTISFQNGTTSFAYGGDGTSNFLVTADSTLPFPITLSLQPSNNSWEKQVTIGNSACPGVSICSSPFTLKPGDSCCLMLDLDGTNLDLGNYLLSPVVATTPATYKYTVSSPTVVKVAGYSVGGAVTGLEAELILTNNGVVLTTSTDGIFTFPTPLTEGSTYHVTVDTQPQGETCTVFHGTGVIGRENVTDVEVNCSTNLYTVGGTVSGLAGTVTLLINDADPTTKNANGNFNFLTPIAKGSPYQVTVQNQPANQTCTVANGTGVIGSANINNVSVTCSTNAYTVGGTISNLVGKVTLLNDDANPTTISTNGNFIFSTPIAQGSPYAVTVKTQPASQTCKVTNGTGIMGGTNVNNVSVTCLSQNTTLSVPSTGTIPVNNGIRTFSVTNNGTTFTATNVKAVLPTGWTGVTQDSTNCASINPGQTCTLTFSSTEPYVAQGNIKITGDNISFPPTTAFAFTMTANNYLVWQVSANTVQVVDTADLPTSPIQWGNSVNIVNNSAFSLTDGAINTNNIFSTPNIGISAAVNCYSSTNGGAPAGTWYLPAICQIGSAGQGAECSSGLANINTNLFQLGFGGLSSGFPPYWSSTSVIFNNPRLAWYNYLSIGSGHTQGGDFRPGVFRARCARSINYP
jgi:hypothetical protein